MDWSGEVSPSVRPAPNGGMAGMNGSGNGMWNGMQENNSWNGGQDSMWGDRPAGMQSSGMNMQNNLPDDVIESPMTNAEVYAGSTKAMLRRNLGNYVVATFLVGTQNTVSWEGILYDVGNDYVTIYQPGRDRYIVNDIYSLRYTEFYDVKRRELCDRLIAQHGGNSGSSNWPPQR